jgi:hypothetical protein
MKSNNSKEIKRTLPTKTVEKCKDKIERKLQEIDITPNYRSSLNPWFRPKNKQDVNKGPVYVEEDMEES